MPENHQVKPNRKKITCSCGQPNYLILQDGVWLFDEKKHGQYVYPSKKKEAVGCINCHAPLNMSSAVAYAGIVQKYPFAAMAHDDCVSDPAEAKQEQIDAIRSQIPDWSPDKPQWAMVRAILLNVFHIPLVDSKELHFDDIAAIFQTDTARNESDAERPGSGKAGQRSQKKRRTRKKPEIEHSLPLPMTKWAYILGVSPNTLRKLRKQKKYHFVQKSERRWTLPKHELPAEYLEQYQHAISQSQSKAQ